MTVPVSLPERIYLLAHDSRRQRARGGWRLGFTLRAAALTELLLTGHLVDTGKKPEAPGSPRQLDPVLAEVLRQVAESRPRTWQHWIRKDRGRIVRSVQEQLVEHGSIKVESRKILGIFPLDRVTLRDTRAAKQLTRQVTGAASGSQPLSRLDPHDGALAALAAAGELDTVFSRAERRKNRKRIRQLEEFTGPVARALRKTIQSQRSAAAAGGGAGGGGGGG